MKQSFRSSFWVWCLQGSKFSGQDFNTSPRNWSFLAFLFSVLSFVLFWLLLLFCSLASGFSVSPFFLNECNVVWTLGHAHVGRLLWSALHALASMMLICRPSQEIRSTSRNFLKIWFSASASLSVPPPLCVVCLARRVWLSSKFDLFRKLRKKIRWESNISYPFVYPYFFAFFIFLFFLASLLSLPPFEYDCM